MILHFEDDSNLAYDCSRKLGRIGIVESVANSSAGKNSAPMPLCWQMTRTPLSKGWAGIEEQSKAPSWIRFIVRHRQYLFGRNPFSYGTAPLHKGERPWWKQAASACRQNTSYSYNCCWQKSRRKWPAAKMVAAAQKRKEIMSPLFRYNQQNKRIRQKCVLLSRSSAGMNYFTKKTQQYSCKTPAVWLHRILSNSSGICPVMSTPWSRVI